MSEIIRLHVVNCVQQRRHLIKSGEYDEYVGRNARILKFMSFVEEYIECRTVPVDVGDAFREQLLQYRRTPRLDASAKGELLHALDEELHAHCADHFQSIDTPQ